MARGLASNVHPTLKGSSATNAENAAQSCFEEHCGPGEGLLAQEALAARAARIASAAASEPAEAGGEMAVGRDVAEEAEDVGQGEQQGESAPEGNASETPLAVASSKVILF